MRRWPTDIRASIFVPTWIVCGTISALIIFVGEQSNDAFYSRLEKHRVVVKATVTRTEPSNHNTVFYSFTAGGKTFASSSGDDPPNPLALKPGERIHVVYDAGNPSYSCACDPRAETASSVWWRVLLSGLFLGSIVAVVLTVVIQRRLDTRGAHGNAQVGLS